MVLFLVYLNIKAFWCILHVHIKLFTFTVLFSTINEDKCLMILSVSSNRYDE